MRPGSGVRCRRERSFAAETMEPLDSNISVSGAVGKRETMQRMAVSIYPKFVESVKSQMSGFLVLLDHNESFVSLQKGWKDDDLHGAHHMSQLWKLARRCIPMWAYTKMLFALDDINATIKIVRSQDWSFRDNIVANSSDCVGKMAIGSTIKAKILVTGTYSRRAWKMPAPLWTNVNFAIMLEPGK